MYGAYSSGVHRNSVSSVAAFTLVEVLVAAAVTAIGFLAVTILNTANLRFVKSARQSNAATLCLQERAEQFRLADWRKITDPVYLRDSLLATPTRSSAPLSGISEKITVAAFPDDTVAQKLIVQRNTDGSRVVLVSGGGLATQQLAKVDLQVSWIGSDGRLRSRATTTLMANGGISRMNLPGFGAAAGAPPPPASTPVPTPTDASSGNTPSATPTPTPTPALAGKSTGRGTIAGKSGKK
jgi:hypothetical protein